uniref:Uncharacterized protein n=1 Tax=Leptospira ellisii TaxID=2023197 RepID=A0A2N0BCM3_9LEPT|nr:hypothetical protein CH379_03635 [Leptospira ellisii]
MINSIRFFSIFAFPFGVWKKSPLVRSSDQTTTQRRSRILSQKIDSVANARVNKKGSIFEILEYRTL